MPHGPRMTIPTQLVLQELLTDPTREVYGLEIGRAAGLASGTVHPILARLEALGWVSSRWEEVDPREASRPARRYYRLTDEGAQAARPALARAARAVRVRGLGAAPVPGQA
jgi:PadR family transcriptional regulator, regulatory protein PadR